MRVGLHMWEACVGRAVAHELSTCGTQPSLLAQTYTAKPRWREEDVTAGVQKPSSPEGLARLYPLLHEEQSSTSSLLLEGLDGDMSLEGWGDETDNDGMPAALPGASQWHEAADAKATGAHGAWMQRSFSPNPIGQGHDAAADSGDVRAVVSRDARASSSPAATRGKKPSKNLGLLTPATFREHVRFTGGKTVIQHFRDLDKNQNGELALEEFVKGVRAMGFVDSTRDECKLLFDWLDRDGSGTIPYKELDKRLRDRPPADDDEGADLQARASASATGGSTQWSRASPTPEARGVTTTEGRAWSCAPKTWAVGVAVRPPPISSLTPPGAIVCGGATAGSVASRMALVINASQSVGQPAPAALLPRPKPVGWVTVYKGGRELVTARGKLDAGLRQQHMQHWARRLRVDKAMQPMAPPGKGAAAWARSEMASGGERAGGGRRPKRDAGSKAVTMFDNELAADPSRVGFAFGGVDPGRLRAKGQLIATRKPRTRDCSHACACRHAQLHAHTAKVSLHEIRSRTSI